MHAELEFVSEQIGGMWRFRWTAMLAAWIVCVIGWLVVLALPDTYSAWARVHIDTGTPLNQVIKEIGLEPNIGPQAETVREALLGSPQLEEVARRAIPRYATASPAEQRSIVEGLRGRLLVETSGGGPGNQPADLYTMRYTDPDWRSAHAVVKELLQLFLFDLTSGAREGAERAQQFLRLQIAEYNKKLQADEARIADFKRKNAALQPGATGDYLARLGAEKDRLATLSLRLQLAEQKANELQRRLTSEAAASGNPMPGGTADTDTAAEIKKSETKLRELRLRYTDKHPDVIETQRTLEELKAAEQAETADVRRGDPAAKAATCDRSSPLHQEICRLSIQADVDLAAAKREVEDQEARIADLNKLIDTAPQVEAQYLQLNRDYEETRAEYHALVDRLNRLELSYQAAAAEVVPLKVVQPPTGSDTPVSPDRPRLILVVLLGGLAAGLGVAYSMHQLRPVFTSASQLGETTHRPVLGTVGTVFMEPYKRKERRAMWAYSAASAILVLVGVIVLLIQSPASQFLHGWIA